MTVHGTDSSVLLTAREAAGFLRICERKLWQLKEDGELAAVMIGRSVRYDRCDLMAFIERQKIDATRGR